jgi:tetratricopeptide (TPR) repeat protein
MEALIVVFGVIILAVIFFRRYLIIEDKLPMTGRRKNMLSHFHLQKPDSFEVTPEEIIPDISTIDSKNIAKAEIQFRKAEILIARGDLRTASKTLIQAISLNPGYLEAYAKLGMIYLHQNMHIKAENIFKKLILSVVDNPSFYSNLGLSLYNQGKLEDAKYFYKKAIELDNSRASRFFALGQIYFELKELEPATDYIRKAILLEPRNQDILLTLVDIYLERNLPEQAIEVLNELLVLSPGNESALKLQEKAGRMRGQPINN